MPDDYIPDENTPRFSQDTKTNTYGTHFLNIIMNNQLTILNGRTLGDMTGNFTSVQKQGCSVVDYFAISQALNNDVNYMKVLDLTPYSDHKPLSMELYCKHIKIECMLPLEQQYEPAPTRFIFNEGNRDAFIQELGTESSQQTLKDLQDTIDRLRDSTTDNNSLTTTTINATNDKFTEHLRSVASNCFKQSKHMNINKQNNKPWFNWHTRTGKRELRKATNTVSGYPDSSFLRDNYYKVKGCYKQQY